MADPRTRPYPLPPQNGSASASSRDRAFNDIFNTGRPHMSPTNAPMPNGTGNGPSVQDARNYGGVRQSPPSAGGGSQYQGGYQDGPKRSPPARQYSQDANYPPPRNQAPPRPQQSSPGSYGPPSQPYDPRIVASDPRVNPAQRQASAPYPQQRYNDIPPSHQRPPQDYSSPNGNDYRTKSLSAYNRPPAPPHNRAQQPPFPADQQYPPSNRMHTTAEGRIVPERAYHGSNQPTSPPHDRSYSLTSAQQRRPEDRSFTMSSDPRGTYAATRAGPSGAQQQQRRPEEGRSNTMSGRMGGNSSPAGSGSPQLDFTRPVAQPRQTTLQPGSPRRAAPPPASASSRSGALALMGVREEGVADPYRMGTASSSAASTPAQHSSLPPIVTTTPGNRHESVDSTYSDQDSIVPQRTKSSSSFPSAGPPSSTTDRRPSLPKAPSSQPSLSRTRAPIVYPALLSRVALALRERLIMGDKQKDGLTYPNAFTGSEAVDIISYVIKTSDRNLALLLGRALDAQRWFHDVTYMHRLRDNPGEVYQFRERVQFDATEDESNGTLSSHNSRRRPHHSPSFDSPDLSLLPAGASTVRTSSDSPEDDYLPNGVFTLLTECYSPTCTRDKLCYSIACPRRLEQIARLNLKVQTGLKNEQSTADVVDDVVAEGLGGDRRLWIDTVSREVSDGVPERERKRQENINEAIYTERDFVKDIEYLRDFWIIPLSKSDIIPAARREKFIRTVFGNILEVHSVNSRLAEALTRRQQSSAIVAEIGDIFLEWVPKFEPFIRYGANQLWGKYEFEKERSANPAFSRFVDDVERKVESRKLELNGYLTKPTTRLARYPLLLGAIYDHSQDDNPDKRSLPQAIAKVKEFLAKVNVESGRSENKFNLMNLNQQLSIRPGEPNFDLKLMEEGRQLIFKGGLARRAGLGSNAESDSLQVFLFDHLLVVVKVKLVNKRETYRIYRKPIPLELLILAQSDDGGPSRGGVAKRPSSGLLPPTKTTTMGINLPGRNNDPANKGYAVTFTHLGRRGYNLTLYAPTWVSRRKWLEHIESQQRLIRERSSIFAKVVVCEKYFMGNNKVNCAVAFDGGRKLAYGTDSGIYVSDRKPHSNAKTTPVRVHPLPNVTQIDVLEEYGLLLVLCDKTLSSYPIELLTEHADSTNFQMNRKAKKVSGHVNFFKAGICLGRVFLCVVKSSAMSSTIKVLEPVEGLSRGRGKLGFAKLLQGGQDFKVFKVPHPLKRGADNQEFYIPTESTSIHFLKSKLCVGCSKGFEIVDLDNLETQSLLDPADTSLDFVSRKEGAGAPKPIAIYRFNGLFLLCYDEFAFFVNKNGWRAKHDWMVSWEGLPQGCAVAYPYLFAFEPSFVEIHSLETGALAQIIPGSNIRLLADGRGKLGEGGEILFACENSLPGAAGGMDGECQVNALIKTGLDFATSPRIRQIED